MTKSPLRIATRGSQLALWQARHIASRLTAMEHGRPVELVEITTTGDRNQTESLSQFGGVGVFTREVQKALLDGRADLAVHSLKDLPTEPVDGLVLAAVPERAPTHDAILLSRSGNLLAISSEQSPSIPTGDEALALLPQNSRIGTGSLRRRAQLLHFRPDLQIEEIRGNVDMRIRKLDEGQYDAIVLAEAGLTRLGLRPRIDGILGPPTMFAAVGQGALGIECRERDQETRDILSALSDEETYCRVLAERALLSSLRAGCHAPLGVATSREGNLLLLEAVVLSADGVQRLVVQQDGSVEEAIQIGRTAAEMLQSLGAEAIINPAH